MVQLSTLCYLEDEGRWLMLHRTVKKQEINKDKWLGIGGRFEAGESPEDCILRETREETGFTLTDYRYRGLVTFVEGDYTEYMSLFTASAWEGDPVPCAEGDLEWVDKDEVPSLNLWEGDLVFFRLLREEVPFFSLKLVYESGTMTEVFLNGRPMEKPWY